MEFVGLENFIKVFQDSTFWVTMKNSILWIVVTVPVQAILGFFLAYAIEERIKSKKADGKAFSRTFYRTLFFIPVVTSVTVVAIMFSKIFQPYQGIIGHYLNSWFGMSPTINVLGNSKAALWGIMLANIWEWTGWSMIMYIGGISQISEDVKEAARIDGANTWQEIIYVYIPALGSVHKSLLMLGIIGSLQTYALIGVMTGGGPNHATEMPGTYIFMKGFTESQMGYACAISVAVLIFALVLTFIQVRFLGSGDFMKKGELIMGAVNKIKRLGHRDRSWKIFLAVMAVIALIPLVYALSLSVRTQNSIYDPRLFVTDLTIGNYIKAISDNPTILNNFISSLVISVISTAATVLCASMAVYGFSRKNVYGKVIMYNLILCTLMVPISALVIPITQLNSRMGLLDNYFGLIFPYIALNIPYAVTILQGFMKGVPKELEEAAGLDGCNIVQLYTRIVMPMLKPGIVVVAIWTFLTCWNEFFLALCTMTKATTKTLPLIAQQYKGVYNSQPGILFAILIIITIPMVIFYCVVQKQFVKGMTAGAVKG